MNTAAPVALMTPQTEFDKVLGSRIRDLRKRYGWTQEHLAERMAMTQHNLSRYERGEYGLSAYRLVLLSKIFAIAVDSWFVDDAAWKNFVRQL